MLAALNLFKLFTGTFFTLGQDKVAERTFGVGTELGRRIKLGDVWYTLCCSDSTAHLLI
jgi:hypothetical protein